MSERAKALAFALVLLAGPTVEATLILTKKDNLDLNWYFHNTSIQYTGMDMSVGYYYDYNSDGLFDYLLVLKDPKAHNWRIFTLNTMPTGGAKTYSADKTAGRDIAAQPGVFVPDVLHHPIAPSMEYPDLVVVGTNQPANQSYYTKFIFWRLNKADKSFPTETTWAIDVVSTDTPYVYWPNVSFNSDDYPDFFLCNSQPNENRQFVITCYDGRNGRPIWSRTLDSDPADPGTGIDFPFGAPRCLPTLTIDHLGGAAVQGVSGDFDNNGKPELFLYYTFGRGDFTSSILTANITLLDSSGKFLSPYSSTWTRVYEMASAWIEPAASTNSDYNKDGYVDLMLVNMMVTTTPPPAVFEGYDLKGRRSLFKSVASDFGVTLPQDLDGFLVLDEWTYLPFRPADVNGDSWHDLIVYRSQGFASLGTPLRVGIFNAYAGGGAQKARKMWLTQFSNYNRAYGNVNDFNSDNLSDYLLVGDPDAPDSPTVGEVTWRLANTAVSAKGITLGKQFEYSAPYSFSWNATHDRFTAYSIMFYPMLDVDGDGQRDTCGQMACGFDDGKNSTWDLGYGYVFVYDNTPGPTPPPLTADLQIRVQGEDWIPTPGLFYAVDLTGNVLVDNNRDGYFNDVVVDAPKAVFSMSFAYRVMPDLPGQVANPNPPNGSPTRLDVILRWSPADDAVSYDVYFGTSLAAVQNATITSPEFQGNQMGVSFDPPTLQVGAIYYWRVDSRNARGMTKGSVWSFPVSLAAIENWKHYR